MGGDSNIYFFQRNEGGLEEIKGIVFVWEKM